MFDVAYTQRSWTDQQEIDAFLGDQQVGVLGLTTEEYPYTVPVNFLWLNGASARDERSNCWPAHHRRASPSTPTTAPPSIPCRAMPTPATAR